MVQNAAYLFDRHEFTASFTRCALDESGRDSMTHDVDAWGITQAMGDDVVSQEVVALAKNRRGNDGVEKARVSRDAYDRAGAEIGVIPPDDLGAEHPGNQREHGPGVPADRAAVHLPSPSDRTKMAKADADPGEERQHHADGFDDECPDHEGAEAKRG